MGLTSVTREKYQLLTVQPKIFGIQISQIWPMIQGDTFIKYKYVLLNFLPTTGKKRNWRYLTDRELYFDQCDEL